MTETREWPELGEELGRKALDVVADRVSRMDDKELSERELWLIADAVYDTIAGLASWEDANVVYTIRNGLTK